MKGSGLGWITGAIDFNPFPLIYIELVDIVESLLICVYSSKYVDVASTYYGWVTVSGLRGWAIGSVDFVPVVWKETVLENVIHCIMAVPATEDKHWILKNYCGMAESV